MQTEELVALVEEIHRQHTEQQTIELKSTEGGFPRKIYGMSDKPDYKVVGVYDAEDVQKKIMEACGQMEPKVRPLITMCEVDGKMVVAAEIPGVDPSLRPVFYSGVGRVKGSYIRVGDADEPMSEYEVYSYEAFRRRIRDELRVVDVNLEPLLLELLVLLVVRKPL